MTNRLLLVLVPLLSVAAFAKDTPAEDEPKPDEPITVGVELNMGFFGGAVDPSALALLPKSDVALSASATPFGGPGVNRLLVAGPSWEARWVESHGRFTVGARKAFAQLQQGSLDTTFGGDALSPRAFSVWDVRLGLGVEYPFKRVTPFVDVLGDLEFAEGDVVFGSQRVSLEGKGFALSVRGGLRVKLDRFLSLGLSGEYGVLGSPRFSGLLTLGWSFSWS